jgi:hypothetical protein
VIAGRFTVVKAVANQRGTTNAAKLTAAISKRYEVGSLIAAGNVPTVCVAHAITPHEC